jgi:hypothetical protein
VRRQAPAKDKNGFVFSLEFYVSLAPGFSPVTGGWLLATGNRLNGFPFSLVQETTWLKPGANETTRVY